MDSSAALGSYRWACQLTQVIVSRLPDHFERDDLQSAGIMGYCQAADHYDPDKGISFRGFCATRIRGAIFDELRRLEWAPRSVRQKQRQIHVTALSLAARLEREPTLTELAGVLNMEVSDLISLRDQVQSHQVISLDETRETSGEDDPLPLTETIPDPVCVSPAAAVLSSEERQTLMACIKKLPGNEATIIELHYLKDIPLQDIARQLHVHPSRVSQLHHQALARLKRTWQLSDTETTSSS